MTPRILVADDSATIQKVVELTFSKEDFQIIKALNGVEAIAKAKESKPDIVLLDLFMPDKSGYEVCESLRGDPQLKEVPIILLVGAFETFDKERSLRSGADDHVTKPFESKKLIAKVKQHLFAKAAKLASQRVEQKEEAPSIPPSVEAPPLTTPMEIPTAAPAVAEAPFAPEWEGVQKPEQEVVEKPSWSLEPEILAPSSAGPVAERAPSAEEEERGVSDEELWQMLDLSGPEAAPLASPAEAEEPELAVMSEDSADAFFALYSQEAASEVQPLPSVEMKAEEPSFGPSLAEEVIREGVGQAEGEVISFENLREAVVEEEVAAPLGEGGPPWEKEVVPPLATEEASGVREEIDSRQAPEVSVEEAISEKEMGSIADRIVKEVTDRLVSRIERIIWEVVPDLAEVLISKEIEKIKAAADEQETTS